MMQDISVRQLKESETENALQLVWQVFMEFVAPDYTDEGVNAVVPALSNVYWKECDVAKSPM